MNKGGRRDRQEDLGPPKRRAYNENRDHEQSRSGSEAGSADRTRRVGKDWTPPSRSASEHKNAASESTDQYTAGKMADADIHDEPGVLRNRAGSGSHQPGHSAPVDKKQRLEADRSQKSTRSDRDVPAAASAAAGKRAQPRSNDVKQIASGSRTTPTGPGHRVNPPARKSKPPKDAEDASPAVHNGDDVDRGIDNTPQQQLYGGWLNILRGAAATPLKVPQDEAGDEAGSPPETKGSVQKLVSTKSPGTTSLKERKLQGASEGHGQHSGSQYSSYEQPADTPLSCHTRDLESETPLQGNEDADEEDEAEGWWWWCSWINLWLFGVVFFMVVVVPLVLLLLGPKGHHSPHEGPDSNASEGGDDPWVVVTPRKPRAPMIPLKDAYNEDELEPTPVRCNFTDPPAPEQLRKPPEPKSSSPTTPKPQYRPVICVVDAWYIFERQSTKGFQYSLKAVPARYCTVMVFYAMTVESSGEAVYKLERGIAQDALQALKDAAQQKHRGQAVPVYMTIGGSRNDRKAILEAIRNAAPREKLAVSLPKPSDIQGINLDWNRPGDACTSTSQIQFGLADLVKNITSQLKLMVTIPPLPEFVAAYELPLLLPYLEYVVVATHKLRRPGVVACSGERVLAVEAFRQIRDQFAKGADAAEMLRKFAYSISVGADIYFLADQTEVKYLAPTLRIGSVFNGREIMLGKTNYPSVCTLLAVDHDADEECRVVMGSRTFSKQTGILQEAAAVAGPQELEHHMRNLYEDGLGETTVAVFDVFLDDGFPSPQCHAETNLEMPLVQTIAETGP